MTGPSQRGALDAGRNVLAQSPPARRPRRRMRPLSRCLGRPGRSAVGRGPVAADPTPPDGDASSAEFARRGGLAKGRTCGRAREPGPAPVLRTAQGAASAALSVAHAGCRHPGAAAGSAGCPARARPQSHRRGSDRPCRALAELQPHEGHVAHGAVAVGEAGRGRDEDLSGQGLGASIPDPPLAQLIARSAAAGFPARRRRRGPGARLRPPRRRCAADRPAPCPASRGHRSPAAGSASGESGSRPRT